MKAKNQITIGFAKRLASETVNLARFAGAGDDELVDYTADTIKREALALEKHLSQEWRLVTACREFIEHIDTFAGLFSPGEIQRSVDNIRAALKEDHTDAGPRSPWIGTDPAKQEVGP